MNPPAGLGTTAAALAAVPDEETVPRVDAVRSRHRDPSLHDEPGPAQPPTAACPSGRPTADPDGALVPRETMHDLSDHELGRIIAIGSVVGMLGIFMIVVAMCLVAGTTLGQASGHRHRTNVVWGLVLRRHRLALARRLREEPNQDRPANPQSVGRQNNDGVGDVA